MRLFASIILTHTITYSRSTKHLFVRKLLLCTSSKDKRIRGSSVIATDFGFDQSTKTTSSIISTETNACKQFPRHYGREPAWFLLNCIRTWSVSISLRYKWYKIYRELCYASVWRMLATDFREAEHKHVETKFSHISKAKPLVLQNKLMNDDHFQQFAHTHTYTRRKFM